MASGGRRAPLTEPRLSRAFRGHRGPVTAVSFLPEEQQVVSSSLDGCIFVWHFRPQLRPYRFVGHKGEVHDIAVTASGRRIASASADRTVRLWKNSPDGSSQVMTVHSAAVRSVCFSQDGALLLTASDDKSVKMWSMATQRFHGSFLGHTNWVYSAVFCKNADLVASGGEDRTVCVWDVEKKSQIASFQDFQGPVTKVCFHPEGSTLAACGRDGCVKLWDLRSRRLLQHYDAHAGAARDVHFHPSGEYLASAGEDEALKVWDLREGRLLYEAFGHKGPLSACAFSPSGRGLISGGHDSLVFVWDSDGQGMGCIGEDAGAIGSPLATPTPARAGRRVASVPARARGGVRASPPSHDRGSRVGVAQASVGGAAASAVPVNLPPPSSSTGVVAWPTPKEGPPYAHSEPATPALPASAVRDGDAAELPKPVAQTLTAIQGQLEIMARTVQLLDRRLSMTEQQVMDLHRELLARGAASAAPHNDTFRGEPSARGPANLVTLVAATSPCSHDQ